jgi:hypothetical protein
MPLETLPPDEPAATEISRRKLLKMLTAAGAGASATVLLSGQWVKPVAAGGQLAPHAQTSRPLTHVISSGNALQDPNSSNLIASATIYPIDPNIPIVATVNDLAGPKPAAVQAAIGTQTSNTNASGVASFVFDPSQFNPFPSCNTPSLEVVFSFANPADGSGTYTAMTPWAQPC